MEGPYRDLGAGFARLTGVEGARRGPSRISYVEDALLELLRNSRDAGATRIYVASTLKNKRYRTLTVIDDGHGIPESHRNLILEPGVTTRHLNPYDKSRRPARHPPRRRPLPLPDQDQIPRHQGPLRLKPHLHSNHLRYQRPPRTSPPGHNAPLENQPEGHPPELRRFHQPAQPQLPPRQNPRSLLRIPNPHPRHPPT